MTVSKMRTKRREKMFSAHSAESIFSVSETKFRDKYSRWMSCDPAVSDYMAVSDVGGGIYNLANFNIYHYGGNNPLRYNDPTGAFDIEEGAAPYEIPINVSNEGRVETMPFALGPQSPAATGGGPRFLGGLPSNIKPLSFADDFKDYTGQNLDEFLEKFNKEHPECPITAKQMELLFTDKKYAMGNLINNPTWHKALRDLLNSKRPDTQSGAANKNWTIMSWIMSIYHEPWNGNVKTVAPDGHMEAVYKNGLINENNDVKGTFNFFGPNDPMGHFFADIIPYKILGN